MHTRSRIHIGMWSLLGAALACVGTSCGSELTLDAPRAAAQVDAVRVAVELLRAPFCTPFAERFCAVSDECGCSSAGGWPSDCVAAVERSCMIGFELQASVIEGGFLVSTDNAEHCLGLVEEALSHCELPPSDTFPTECSFITPVGGLGFLRAGDTCTFGGPACGRGLRCGSLGRCRPPLGENERCQSIGDCEPGFECNGRCQRPQRFGVGEPCDIQFQNCPGGTFCGTSQRRSCQGSVEGDLCRFQEDCDEHDFCIDSRCVPRPLEGEPCLGFGCDEGLGCNTAIGTCERLPGRGEPCLSDEFGSFVCASGLACRAGLLCESAPRLGEICTFGLTGECADDLVCTITPEGFSECGLPGEVDEPCQDSRSCRQGLTCDFNTFTCKSAPGEGERCNTIACQVPFDCVEVDPGDRRCARVNSIGDACVGSCPDVLTCDFDVRQGACVPPMCLSIRF